MTRPTRDTEQELETLLAALVAERSELYGRLGRLEARVGELRGARLADDRGGGRASADDGGRAQEAGAAGAARGGIRARVALARRPPGARRKPSELL